ncbi:hypothetical protein CIW83_20775 [Tissierella sp. P1]|uniref:Ger(x)C family spore germination protein n=1 Tax=Tissierella sp. P1 TaxID=1280483 RepID=UPI000BA0966E|nr:Ger(x)C family spore germination protein [Tissierella sp. P1]OZV10358.1 hypothetical protein CIW83_20775 [Tissierella sp. P1]
MINKIRIFLFMFLIINILLLSGCWDYEDINNRSITLSVGINKVDEEIIFNGEIAKLISESNKSGTSASITDTYYYSSSGKNFEEAKYDYDYKIPTVDFSGAIRAIVFSKKYAKEKGIESYINRFSFMPGFRSSVLTVISEQHTEELFKEKVVNDISTGHSIENTIRYLEKDGATIYTTVEDIRHNISFAEIGFLVPYIKREEDTIKYLGLAVIKDSKFIGAINAEDSSGILYLIIDNASSIEAIPSTENKTNFISVKTKLRKRKVTTSCKDGEIYIDIKLELDSKLIYEYIQEPISDETIKELESIIANKVKNKVVSSIERSQKEFKCDIFGFARHFKADNPVSFNTVNWTEVYPDIHFNVKVKSKIINYNFINTKVKGNNKGEAE